MTTASEDFMVHVENLIDGRLDEAGGRELLRSLAEQPDLRRELLCCTAIDGLLRCRSGGWDAERLTARVMAALPSPIRGTRIIDGVMTRLGTQAPPRHQRSRLRLVLGGAVVVAAALLAILLWPGHPALSSSGGALLSARGPVTVGDGRDAGRGGSLVVAPGETIAVAPDASAILRWPDGSQVDLGSSTRLRLEAATGKQVTLFSGSIMTEVAPQPADAPFVVHVSDWEVVVHGTRFRATTTADHGIQIDVERGQVGVRRNGAGAETMLAAGDTWTLAAGAGSGVRGRRKDLTLDLGGGVTMRLIRIPAGTFLMGSPDPNSSDDRQHQVTLSKPILMGVHEVTQAQFQQLMDSNPVASGDAHNTGAEKPVTMQTWPEAVEFCARLSARSGRTVRLPTEAEWEHAARAGTTTTWSFGDDEELLFDHCWFTGSSGGNFTHPVGELLPNPWGLYDIHGNVWEMCSDWMAPYGSAPAVDPRGPEQGTIYANHGNRPVHVCRGGSYHSGAGPILGRYGYADDIRKPHIGFRVVVEAE